MKPTTKKIILIFIFVIYSWLLFFIGVYATTNKEIRGLRIDNAYIKVIEPCKQELNDLYIDKMIKFADECDGEQKFFRFVNIQNKLYGVSLWCKNTSKSFIFFYSDKWLKNNYGDVKLQK